MRSLPLTVLLLAAACSKQGLGDRCDERAEQAGGESDCESGLKCTPYSDLQGQNSARCCTPGLDRPDIPTCQPKSSGQGEAGIPDSGSDAGSDAPSDASDAADAADAADGD